jgi:hypothetical protein
MTARTYRNETGLTLQVTTRDGVTVSMPGDDYDCTGQFVVKVTYSMRREAMVAAMAQLKRNEGYGDAETAAIIRAMHFSDNDRPGSVVEAEVEYILQVEDLTEVGGRIYLEDLDLMVEDSRVARCEHPYSRARRELATLEAMVPNVGPGTFVFMLKAVDNSPMPQYADRFVNLGGQVYRVPVEQDSHYQTGVHLVTRSPVDAESPGRLVTRTKSFAEADREWRLYRTIEEARHGVPFDDLAKRRYEELLQERRELEAALKIQNLKMEDEALKQKQELGQVRHTQEVQLTSMKGDVERYKALAATVSAFMLIFGMMMQKKTT